MQEVQKKKYPFSGTDWLLVSGLVLIMFLGLINLYSASMVAKSPFYIKQAIWYATGMILMITIYFMDYRSLAHYTNEAYWACVFSLLLVLLLGKIAGGSRRWLDLGLFNFQPSEFAKIIMVFVLAKYFQEVERHVYGFKELIKPAFFAAIPCALIIKQPDLGTTLMICIVLGSMVFIARIRWSTLVALVVGTSAAVPFFWKYMEDYQKDRILIFLKLKQDPAGAEYHIIQSKVAIGSGGLWGKGYLHGTQAHLSFLPEVHTDFAFSLWGEEWGFVGAVVLISLYVLVVFRGMRIAFEARDRLGAFLAFGITAMFFWQTIVNINMVLGLLPVVGVPLPLFSYGGSSVIVTLMGMGILLSVNSRKYFFQRN